MFNKIIYLFLLLCSLPAGANELTLFKLDKLSLEVWKIGDNRDPYLPYDKPGKYEGHEEWLGGAAFQINTTLLNYKDFKMYWDNKPYLNGTHAQVRQAGWEWEAGAEWKKCYDVFWHHHSTHLVDATGDGLKYPLINRFGARITFKGNGCN